jgi:hypothetical protein
LLTGKESLVSTGKRIDGKAVVSALSSWLDAWNEKNTFERFTSLSDELLTCGIWQVWTQCQKSFGTAVDAADSVVNGRIDVETGLKRIRDAFSASEDEFRLRSAELAQLEVAVIVEPLRQEILAEIAACDITDDARTEGLRNTLRNSIDAPVNDAVEIVELRELLDEFRDAYSEYFIACHDMASRANKAGDRAAELLRSDRWWIFENLASIPAMPQNFRHESRAILRELRMGNCGFNLAHVPGRVVSCTCGFSPALSQRQYQLPAQLSSVVDRGLSAFRAVIIGRNGQIAETLKNMLRGVNDPALAGLARELSSRLTADADLSSLNDAHVRLLRYLLAGPDHRPVQHDIVTEISSDAVMVAEEVHEEEAILHI